MVSANGPPPLKEVLDDFSVCTQTKRKFRLNYYEGNENHNETLGVISSSNFMSFKFFMVQLKSLVNTPYDSAFKELREQPRLDMARISGR
jgi:hypothetical protein